MVYPIASLPQTSSAVNIQIIEPKNFGHGATAGTLGNGSPMDTFQSAPPNPYAPPQQQLMDAYNQAMASRNAAEQARQNYMNLANNLNNQAFQRNAFNPYPQNQFAQGFLPNAAPFQQNVMNAPNGGFMAPPALPPNPFAQGPMGMPQGTFNPMDPNAAMMQQQLMQQQAQNPFAPNPWDPNAQWQQQQLAQQWQQQQQQLQQEQMQQQLQKPAAPQPEPTPPQPPVDAKPALNTMPIEELNRVIAQPQTIQERVNAMEEVGLRGQGTPETYELLKQEALADTSQLPPGQAQDDANYVRQAALWTLGMLNRAQNGQTPAANLPGLSVIRQVLADKNENPDVKASAIQALQVINRPNEKEIKKILKQAARDKNADVKRLAKEALAGKSIPLPTQQAQAAMA